MYGLIVTQNNPEYVYINWLQYLDFKLYKTEASLRYVKLAISSIISNFGGFIEWRWSFLTVFSVFSSERITVTSSPLVDLISALTKPFFLSEIQTFFFPSYFGASLSRAFLSTWRNLKSPSVSKASPILSVWSSVHQATT